MSIRTTPAIGHCGAVSDNGIFCTYEVRKNGEPHKGEHSWYVRPAPVPPTVDEMLESIATKLKSDVESIMLACSENEGWLRDMYTRSKESRLSVMPVQR